MNEMAMVDRVARAIGEAALKDDPGRTELNWPDIFYPDANGGLNLVVLALAAIEAMRTETPVMWDAGEKYCDQTDPGVIWRIMIDAALGKVDA